MSYEPEKFCEERCSHVSFLAGGRDEVPPMELMLARRAQRETA